MKKQMAYANANAVPFVAIVGSDELAQVRLLSKIWKPASRLWLVLTSWKIV